MFVVSESFSRAQISWDGKWNYRVFSPCWLQSHKYWQVHVNPYMMYKI